MRFLLEREALILVNWSAIRHLTQKTTKNA